MAHILLQKKRELLYTSLGMKTSNNIFKDREFQFNSLNQILEFNQEKFNNKKCNISKFMYGIDENANQTKIFDLEFITLNWTKAHLIIKNKKHNLMEKIHNEKKKNFSIKIKFLDNIVCVKSMFEECNTLISVFNFSCVNTKFIGNMSCCFLKCSNLKYLPDISEWNIIKVNDISCFFYECSSLRSLPDISKWNVNNIIDISYLFY